MRNRVDKTELQNRIDVLINLRARGATYSQLVDMACKQWEISDRHARRYLKMAKDQVSREMQQTASAQFGDLVAKTQVVYLQALQEGNLRMAMSTIRECARLIEKERKERQNEALQSRELTDAGQKELEKFLCAFEEEQTDESA